MLEAFLDAWVGREGLGHRDGSVEDGTREELLKAVGGAWGEVEGA